MHHKQEEMRMGALVALITAEILCRSQHVCAFAAPNPARSLRQSQCRRRRCPNFPVFGIGGSASRGDGGGDYGKNDDGDDEGADDIYDVAIIGSGPASCSLAALLAAAASDDDGPRVVLLSKFADKRWVPNYGCWTDEWTALDGLYADRGVPGLMERGADVFWKDTDCFFGESDDDDGPGGDDGDRSEGKGEGDRRRTLGRAYLRVSREGLKGVFYGEGRNYEVIREDVLGRAVNPNVFAPSNSVTFHETFTELTLKESGRKVRSRIVVDGTGAESPFTIRDGRDREGYQVAYGVEATVDGPGVAASRVGDYDRSRMTLFDFRSEAWRDELPHPHEVTEPAKSTFNYVMPLDDDRIFFEETSLVANPAMSFRECKRRLEARLKSQGVNVVDVFEEEYCYIPMGGGLPRKGQRIVPVGAASGLVHPSTGYQLGRALSSNVDVADQILRELDESEEKRSSFDPDAAAARIVGRIWTKEAMRRKCNGGRQKGGTKRGRYIK